MHFYWAPFQSDGFQDRRTYHDLAFRNFDITPAKVYRGRVFRIIVPHHSQGAPAQAPRPACVFTPRNQLALSPSPTSLSHFCAASTRYVALVAFVILVYPLHPHLFARLLLVLPSTLSPGWGRRLTRHHPSHRTGQHCAALSTASPDAHQRRLCKRHVITTAGFLCATPFLPPLINLSLSLSPSSPDALGSSGSLVIYVQSLTSTALPDGFDCAAFESSHFPPPLRLLIRLSHFFPLVAHCSGAPAQRQAVVENRARGKRSSPQATNTDSPCVPQLASPLAVSPSPPGSIPPRSSCTPPPARTAREAN
ncbi:hypothetical protein C8R47DRAFT_1210177 [Mycena vitilis]|nr:hypothetical protein C8R47DRAFT_1210177 [Mycena vitilis]